MKIIIGLGNPGKKFEKTRHNIGFRALDEFFEKNRDRSNFSNFKLEKKFNSLISEGCFNDKKIIIAGGTPPDISSIPLAIVKPQTFMNESGKAAKLLNSKFKILNSELFVIHDDIDLPLGKIRISIGRGSAGHKGVQSIIKELNSKDFVRFRIGIQPKTGKPKNPEKFVLQNFSKEEEKVVKEAIKKTIEAIEIAVREGTEKAMSEYNR